VRRYWIIRRVGLAAFILFYSNSFEGKNAALDATCSGCAICGSPNGKHGMTVGRWAGADSWWFGSTCRGSGTGNGRLCSGGRGSHGFDIGAFERCVRLRYLLQYLSPSGGIPAMLLWNKLLSSVAFLINPRSLQPGSDSHSSACSRWIDSTDAQRCGRSFWALRQAYAGGVDAHSLNATYNIPQLPATAVALWFCQP